MQSTTHTTETRARMKPPRKPLPYGSKYKSADDYIDCLLSFVTSSSLHQSLCGGVHILDFLTRDPDLYADLLPLPWRLWFENVSIDDILDLFLREDISALGDNDTWRGYTLPPRSLVEFIYQVRDLCLDRTYQPDPDHPPAKLDRRIVAGMNNKKEHEVSQFASFAAGLSDSLSDNKSGLPSHKISHLVDFGSGQNYLGRVLAGPTYQKHVVALESRIHNIEGAKRMDVNARLAKKTVVWRNKKMYKEEGRDDGETFRLSRVANAVPAETEATPTGLSQTATRNEPPADDLPQRVTYLEHVIEDGDLSDVADEIKSQTIANGVAETRQSLPEFLVISLHSCGNLVHHGVRSLVLNPSVKAVAMIGCCYNLCTERLGPPTYKLPSLGLRSANPRLVKTSLTCDPHGFPMSKRFLEYSSNASTGVRFNITARMMAVQAPANWTKDECEGFFTRHFYRALLQRIFLDIGFINHPIPADDVIGGSERGWTGGTEPIIIGSLTKACYKNFVAYVRGAVQKISRINAEQGAVLEKCLENLTDEDIFAYEQKYTHKRHELCIVWSLMAFSAQLVECAIVADRWSFLKEQEDVATAWVQTVFDYKQSPRNLAIIGIKK